MASCVKTKIVGSSITAESRMARRASSLKMKNVAPNARIFESASPFTVAAAPGGNLRRPAVGEKEVVFAGPSIEGLARATMRHASCCPRRSGKKWLVRSAVAVVAVDDVERGTAFRALEDLEGAREAIHV